MEYPDDMSESDTPAAMGVLPWRILDEGEFATCMMALRQPGSSGRLNRKPLKMRLPHEELTTRQLVRHRRDALHREEW